MWIDKDLVFLICSYTMDVKLEKAEDVITQKLLLDLAKDAPQRLALAVQSMREVFLVI
jgi:hypothetical protein